MNNLLLSALSAMSAAQFTRSVVAQNGADDSAGHGYQGSEDDDFAEQLLHRSHADATTAYANEDRRGKNAAGHGRHGRRATDFPD